LSAVTVVGAKDLKTDVKYLQTKALIKGIGHFHKKQSTALGCGLIKS
jgi:hypothetical protein